MSYGILVSIVFLVFRNWFITSEIIGGDWPYFFPENLREVKLFPPLWTSYRGNGVGGINPLLNLYLFQAVLVVPFVQWFGLSWNTVYKFGWFGLFLFLSVVSSRRLIRILFRTLLNLWREVLGITIFLTNTYVLMLVGGGQLGVALAYSVAPLVLAQFMELIKSGNFKRSIIAGLVLTVQAMFDPRIAYITMVGVGLYYIFNLKAQNLKLLFINLFLVFGMPSLVTLGLHAFWILPLVKSGFGLEGLGGVLAGTGMAKFLSFASFSNTISLLHPNWPENIFGKTYFMRPGFLLVPLLAYSSLLFVNNQKSRKNILFFSLLALLGAFLAKGANPPFGGIYLWLFRHVPGFVLFRDPTKFYLLVVLPYSVLIPYALCKLGKMKNFFTFIFVLFWLFTIKEAVMGQLGGTFKTREVPKEYLRLKDFIYQQPEFFRTLWLPRQQRFAFCSKIHPCVEAGPLFQATNSAELTQQLRSKGSQQLLSELGIKYLIIPYDSLGELFLRDRRYNEEERMEIEKQADSIHWFKKIQTGKTSVYETPSHKDHFWLEGEGRLSYKMISPAKYKVSVDTSSPTKLVFSENFSPSWVAITGDETIRSEKTIHNLNSFKLNKIGSYSLEIYFLRQNYLYYGLVISFVAFLGVIITLFMLKSKKYDV